MGFDHIGLGIWQFHTYSNDRVSPKLCFQAGYQIQSILSVWQVNDDNEDDSKELSFEWII